ncbi:MAG: ABC transporter ATP-binding protein [Chryseolinea sp.]
MMKIDITKKLIDGAGYLDLHLAFNVSQGEVLAIYGPSGAGKTSVIRMIAGLLKPDDGFISVGGQDWLDKKRHVNLTPQQRNIGVVFQDYTLFPNMTVIENISYALDKDHSGEIVNEILNFMELTNLRDKRPNLLSGGQKQRVALARAIIRRPKVLLLDEPTSALDTSLRLKMQDYIAGIHQQFGLTTILVSHDVLEVARLANRVLVIEKGAVKADGLPKDVLPIKMLSEMIRAIGEK